MSFNQARPVFSAIFAGCFGFLFGYMGYGITTGEFWIATILFNANGLLMGVKS